MTYPRVCSRCKATALVLCLALLQALLIPASACNDDSGDGTDPIGDGGTDPMGDGGTDPIGDGGTDPVGDGGTDPIGDNNGAECLIGGSATLSGCPITTQTPTLQIPEGVSGYVVIADGTSAGLGSVWSSAEQVSGGDTFEVPPDAGLQPLHSYQWTVSSDVGGSDAQFVWQGFTVDFVRSGIEPQDGFGPFTINLASQTLQHTAQTIATRTASGWFQFGFTHRSAFSGTVSGAPYFIDDPTGILPQGWLLTGVESNVPWTRIEQVTSLGGGTEAVLLYAYDGSVLEYTNTGDGEAGWTPPLGVGRPANTYGSLSKSGSTFTWISGTQVVVFEPSPNDATVWLASESYTSLPGSNTITPGLALSWDSEGRLSAISDQSSINSDGTAQRVASFYYSGDSKCGTPSGTDLYGNTLQAAPTGKLCAFEGFESTTSAPKTTQLYYTTVSEVTDPQIGQIVLPGDTVWTYGWQPTTYSTGNLTVTVAQLQLIQTPTGHDAVSDGVVDNDLDASWGAAWSPFDAPEGIVSPLPGTGNQASNRIGKYYNLDCSDDTPTACIYLATSPSVSTQGVSVGQGALLAEITHDAAWRPLGQTTYIDATTTLVTTATWDPELDVPLTQTSAGATGTTVYDFLGRPSVACGPDPTDGSAVSSCTAQTTGAVVSTRAYNGGGLGGWIGTAYENQTLSGAPATSESFNTAQVSLSGAPVQDTSNGWSMLLRSYIEAPADGSDLRFRVVGGTHGSATLWVNGSCKDSESIDPGTSACTANNTVSADPNIRTGGAIQLVVQYTSSGDDPVSIDVQQSVNEGAFSSLGRSALDPGYGMISDRTQSDTLSLDDGSPDTLTRSVTRTFEAPLFGTLQSQNTTGFDGALTATPSYETSYAPEDSEWKRLIAIRTPGAATFGTQYWENTATSTDPGCGNASVIQAGRVQSRLYPDPATGAATNSQGAALGLSRSLSYDAAGRTVGIEVLPASGDGVTACVRYDDRGRKVTAQVSAYAGTLTSGGALQRDWAYTDGSLTTTVTDTFESAPPCNASGGTTCSTRTTQDLLGRTVQTTDVWGATIELDYPLTPSESGFSSQVVSTLTAGDYSITETTSLTRAGGTASYDRTDLTTSGQQTEPVSADINATTTYDAEGRLSTITTTSGGTEVAKVTYTYDAQNRLTRATWTQDGEPLLDDTLTLADNSSRTLGESLCVQGTLDGTQCSGTSYGYTYGYNEAGWLVSAALQSSDTTVVPTTSWDYGYAAGTLGTNPEGSFLDGNLSSMTTIRGTDETTTELGYDFMSRIEETSSVESDDVEHDALGNLTKLGSTSLTYNQLNQLVGVDDGATTVELRRLSDGTLYEKTTTVDTTPTTIAYASGGLVLDENLDGSSQTVPLGPGLFATLDLSTPSNSRFTVGTLQNSNALLDLGLQSGAFTVQGTPTLLSPHGERLTNATAFDPEEPQYDWLSSYQLERLPGDLVLMGKRAYHVGLARFTSVDPRFGGGLNPYNYANADFINNVDPQGTSAVGVYLVIVGILAVIVGVMVYIICTDCGGDPLDYPEYSPPPEPVVVTAPSPSPEPYAGPFPEGLPVIPSVEQYQASSYQIGLRDPGVTADQIDAPRNGELDEAMDGDAVDELLPDAEVVEEINPFIQAGVDPTLVGSSVAVETLEASTGISADLLEEIIVISEIAAFLP